MSTVLAPEGVVRPVIFGKPVGALDAAGVCEYFGRSTKNAAATMADLKRQPGFPRAIKPWGARGHERWNIEELDAWRLNLCPRAIDEDAAKVTAALDTWLDRHAPNGEAQ